MNKIRQLFPYLLLQVTRVLVLLRSNEIKTQNLRTLIVSAAVHWGFSSNREVLPLTFQHWAGVSPYTSTFVFAETYVFGKQFRGLFSCGPLIRLTILFVGAGKAVTSY